MTPQLVTRFLTGDLVGILLASAILTWPVCWVLLRVYTRTVRRSMRRTHGTDRSADHQAVPPIPYAYRRGGDPGTTDELTAPLLRRPWRAARVYAAAGIAYGLTIAIVTAWFADPEAPFAPLRLLVLTTSFAWPAVIAMGIVAASTRRQRALIVVGYAAVYLALAGVAVSVSATAKTSELLLLFVLHNAPSTALVALCLTPRIRAVGPLVLLFLILGFVGAECLVLITSVNDQLLAAAVELGGSFGLGGVATFWAILGSGFIAFGVIGAAMLFWIRRRYVRKLTSDESLTIHTMWWLFVFGHAIELAFEHPLAPLSGVVAMLVFTGVTRVGFAGAVRQAGAGRNLLLLRSFSIGPRSERLFDAFAKHWRRVGSIEMIAGFDLATRTIDPHEFLDFMTGKVSRLFIDGRETLDRRLREMDRLPDRDGRFRVNEFFCYDDTWRDVLLALVGQADAVLMDLRGFSRQNAGCVYEIRELFRFFPIERIVFLSDGQTDRAFLTETFAGAVAYAGLTGRGEQPRVIDCDRLDDTTLRGVLRAVAAAVRPVAVTPG